MTSLFINISNHPILCVSEGYTLEKDAVRAATNLIQDIQSGVVELIVAGGSFIKRLL